MSDGAPEARAEHGLAFDAGQPGDYRPRRQIDACVDVSQDGPVGGIEVGYDIRRGAPATNTPEQTIFAL